MENQCVKETQKKYTTRPSPPYSAVACPGMTLVGNDGQLYMSKLSGKTFRWVVVKSDNAQPVAITAKPKKAAVKPKKAPTAAAAKPKKASTAAAKPKKAPAAAAKPKKSPIAPNSSVPSALKECVKQTTKKFLERPSPPYPATGCPGMMMRGNNGKVYRSVESGKTYRWVLAK